MIKVIKKNNKNKINNMRKSYLKKYHKDHQEQKKKIVVIYHQEKVINPKKINLYDYLIIDLNIYLNN